ncbi:MAG: hypothetical protein IJH34_08945, partial [Romboutsia sp.]|nr:hypothetical protein [Romboutsia sp.]
MKFKKRIGTIALSIGLIVSMTGCVSFNNTKKSSDIEKAILTIVDSEELITVKEDVISTDKNKKEKKDVTITLNLNHSSETIAYDDALRTITKITNMLESVFKEEMNNYKFIINYSDFDIYVNEQKAKLLEVALENNEVEKINFDNFDYRNLDKIAKIKKFAFLEDKTSEENTEIKANNENETEEIVDNTKDTKEEITEETKENNKELENNKSNSNEIT